MKISELQAGTPVRMKRNPGRTGSITGKTREPNYYQIRFGDGLQWIPENQIEIITERDDLFEIFKHGNLGGPNDLEEVLRHTRISGKLSNIFYSMESTNTDFHAFQYKPILKILDSPSNSLLIADEVGLGKTIEAGLIWTELRSRLDYRNLLVVCPAMLREKWRIELQKRFGVEASIVDAKNLERKLRETQNHLGIHEKEFALIASMQGIRSSKTKKTPQDLHKTLEEFKYEEPIIDLLIIDEAHYLKNPNSKTHEIGRLLVAISNHRLFLSATPIHLGSEDLFHILNLLDETTFYNNDIFDEILSANAPLVKAIDYIKQSPPNIDGVNKYLKKATKHPLLKMNRQLKHLKEEMKNNEITNLQQVSQISYKLSDANLLSNIVTRTRKRDIQINRVVRHPISEIIPMSLVENKAYNTVTNLIEKYAEDLPISEAFLIVMPQKRLSSCMAAGVGHWESLKNNTENEQEKSEWDFLEQKQYDIGPLNQYLMDNVQKIGDYNELRRDDSKYERLIEILRNFNAKYKKEKVILFSFFKATLRYLHDRLTQDGYSSLLLMGGNNNKDEIIAEFKSNPKYTILLSSEVASEGVDLQFARFLINYDLPWNPMKIEQRIGRIDRIGQIADKINIWNLVYQNTIDELILERLYNRLDIFRYALGDIEDVLGKEIQQLTSELLSGQLSEDEKNKRIVLTKRAVENKINEEKKLEERASSLMVHGDYILQKINNAKENDQWIRAEDIACYTIEFLKKEYENFEAVRLMDPKYKHIYKIKMPSDAKYQFEEFIKNRNISFHSSLISTDPRPVTCVFDNKIVIEFNEFEIINHLHPIIQWIGESINASFLHLYPVSRIQVKRDDTNIPSHTFIPGKYGYAIQYWNVKGLREYNQLAYKVISIPENDFLDDYNAEQFIKNIIRKGKPFYNKMLTKELGESEEYIFRAKIELDDKFSKFIDYNNCLNQDFADIQERNCEKYYHMNSRHLSRIISEHENRLINAISPAEEGRFRGLIKVNQNKLTRSKEQYERKIRSIRESRAISCHNTDIAIGLIEVLP